MFKCFHKKRTMSSAEIESKLLNKAKKYGIDRNSLTTSIGGITRDNSTLYQMVREEEAHRRSKASFWISIAAIIISILALLK